MSGFNGSMINGVNGMTAQTAAIVTISDNIANAQTIGYKSSVTRFETLVADNGTQARGNGFNTGSVKPILRQLISNQGLTTTDGYSTSIALSGNGFFPVVNSVNTTTGLANGTAQRSLTRAGDFRPDKDGFLVNTNGYYLLGVPLTVTTSTSSTGAKTISAPATPVSTSSLTTPAYESLQPIQIDPNATLAAKATANIDIYANLPASQAAGTSLTQDVTMIDANGAAMSVTLQYTKDPTIPNQWSVTAISQTTTDPTTGAQVTITPTSGTATLTFDATGKITSGDFNLGTFTSSLGGTVTPNFRVSGTTGSTGVLTQSDSQYGVLKITQDGYAQSSAVGVSIDNDGIVSQTFANGKSVQIAAIPVVTFVNADGLTPLTGTIWIPSGDSGSPIVNFAKQNGAGAIYSEELEQSTVDLSDEFTNMIISQRTYTANSKVITTVDEMYQNLTSLGR